MNSYFVVAGMLKESLSSTMNDNNIQNLLNHIQAFELCFQKVHIVIVCNPDAVYQKLQNLKPNFQDRLHLILAPHTLRTDSRCQNQNNQNNLHTYDYRRLDKMAGLRNIYLDYIRNHAILQNFDLLGVLDMDLLGTIQPERIRHSTNRLLSNSEFDGIACNGKLAHWKHQSMYLYFDSFSFVDSMGRHTSKWERMNPFLFLWRYPKLQNSHSKLQRVQSAFGGFCLYKMVPALGARYATKKIGQNYTSEHIFFHSYLSLALDPSLLFLITHNTT
ncbi:MAG: hypothetical protein EOP45_05060 [Sphingobacteriaceae bacterium]|nr:MAG: hypothetical protein EOP45_05060 [Sphingobacteriaceae bacterium]